MARGELAVNLTAPMAVVSDYNVIKSSILGGEQSLHWLNPAIVAEFDIPAGPLREILANRYTRWNNAMEILGNCLGAKENQFQAQFREYFTVVAKSIRSRQQRTLRKLKVEGQKEELVYQLDVVKDLAVPVITCFFIDFLGFWNRVKTDAYPNREFSEDAIYKLMDDCQDYQSWDTDQTKGNKRRQTFQTSIKKLKEVAEYGVRRSSSGILWWRNAFRTYGAGTEPRQVMQMRRLAVTATQTLLSKGFSQAEVSAIMLAFALDSAHNLVQSFTETLAYFIDPKTREHCWVGPPAKDPRTKHFQSLQNLSLNPSPENDVKITQYALEAQRLRPSPKLAPQYVGQKPTPTHLNGKSVANSTTVFVDTYEANRNPEVFPSPNEFRLDRDPSTYLIYGSSLDEKGKKRGAPFAKQLSLAYLTSMLKHAATLKELRVAHDKRGRLKRVTTPSGLAGYKAGDELVRYASPQWGQLLPFPATWEVRYNGVGAGVFAGGDNANQGHGQNQVYSAAEWRCEDAEMKAETKSETEEAVKELVGEVGKRVEMCETYKWGKLEDMVSVREVADELCEE